MVYKENEFVTALGLIERNIVKIIKVNYIDGTYEIVKAEKGDFPKSNRAKVNILAWANEFIENGNIIDVNLDLNKLTYNLRNIQEHFKNNKEYYVSYKRKNIKDGEFHWAVLKLYKINKSEALLYIFNFEKSVGEKLEIVYKQEYADYIDIESQFKNKKSLTNLIERYKNRKVGIMYFKLKSLKNLNKFSTVIRESFSSGYYRLSKNEFVVLCTDYARSRFNQKYAYIISLLASDDIIGKHNKLYKENYTDIAQLIEKVKNDDK